MCSCILEPACITDSFFRVSAFVNVVDLVYVAEGATSIGATCLVFRRGGERFFVVF